MFFFLDAAQSELAVQKNGKQHKQSELVLALFVWWREQWEPNQSHLQIGGEDREVQPRNVLELMRFVFNGKAGSIGALLSLVTCLETMLCKLFQWAPKSFINTARQT